MAAARDVGPQAHLLQLCLVIEGRGVGNSGLTTCLGGSGWAGKCSAITLLVVPDFRRVRLELARTWSFHCRVIWTTGLGAGARHVCAGQEVRQASVSADCRKPTRRRPRAAACDRRAGAVGPAAKVRPDRRAGQFVCPVLGEDRRRRSAPARSHTNHSDRSDWPAAWCSNGCGGNWECRTF